MEYRLSNRTLLKSVDGTLNNIQTVESDWGNIDYLWLIDEPGTITIKDSDEVITVEKPGLLIKTYKKENIPSKVFMLYSDAFVEYMKGIKTVKEARNECCDCCPEPEEVTQY
jgi:hypothetical protein